MIGADSNCYSHQDGRPCPRRLLSQQTTDTTNTTVPTILSLPPLPLPRIPPCTHSSSACLTRGVKEVRFFIAEGSASESDSSETKGQYLKPQDPAPIMDALKSGSKWTSKDLQCLSVEY